MPLEKTNLCDANCFWLRSVVNTLVSSWLKQIVCPNQTVVFARFVLVACRGCRSFDQQASRCGPNPVSLIEHYQDGVRFKRPSRSRTNRTRGYSGKRTAAKPIRIGGSIFLALFAGEPMVHFCILGQ